MFSFCSHQNIQKRHRQFFPCFWQSLWPPPSLIFLTLSVGNFQLIFDPPLVSNDCYSCPHIPLTLLKVLITDSAELAKKITKMSKINHFHCLCGCRSYLCPKYLREGLACAWMFTSLDVVIHYRQLYQLQATLHRLTLLHHQICHAIIIFKAEYVLHYYVCVSTVSTGR